MHVDRVSVGCDDGGVRVGCGERLGVCGYLSVQNQFTFIFTHSHKLHNVGIFSYCFEGIYFVSQFSPAFTTSSTCKITSGRIMYSGKNQLAMKQQSHYKYFIFTEKLSLVQNEN